MENYQRSRMNSIILEFEKRWGQRPYKANVYTAYDFKEGWLKGFSVGGGVRWQSANIMGGTDDGSIEFKGREILENDLMFRYHRKWKSRNITYQVNIYNVLDDTEPIPQRLPEGYTENLAIPGGHGRLAYTRLDLVAPRSIRASVALDF